MIKKIASIIPKVAKGVAKTKPRVKGTPFYIPSINSKLVRELEKLPQDEFITRSVNFLSERYRLPYPPIQLNVPQLPVLAAYSPTFHQIQISGDFINKTKAEQFALLAHEICHARQTADLLRTRTLGTRFLQNLGKAREETIEISVKNGLLPAETAKLGIKELKKFFDDYTKKIRQNLGLLRTRTSTAKRAVANYDYFLQGANADAIKKASEFNPVFTHNGKNYYFNKIYEGLLNKDPEILKLKKNDEFQKFIEESMAKFEELSKSNSYLSAPAEQQAYMTTANVLEEYSTIKEKIKANA